MTARPLVFYVIQRRLDAEAQGSVTQNWKEGLATNTVAVIDSCITAARATTMIMDAAAKHNLIGKSSQICSYPSIIVIFVWSNLTKQISQLHMGILTANISIPPRCCSSW